MRKGDNWIWIAGSAKGVDSSWTYARDVITNVEGVASDIDNLVDVVNHEEVDTMDEWTGVLQA